MNDESAPLNETEPDLPAIDFQSPGRFSVHNPVSDALPPRLLEPAPFRLGEHAALERFHTPEQAQAHALALLQQAQSSICLYSPDLEHLLYNHSSVQDACTQLLLANPRNQLRILLRDVSRPIKNGHRLLNLAQRITSNLHIRKINPDLPSEDSAYLLVDRCSLLLRPKPETYSGYALYNDAGRVRGQQAQFNQAWDTSLLDPDLRSFLL